MPKRVALSDYQHAIASVNFRCGAQRFTSIPDDATLTKIKVSMRIKADPNNQCQFNILAFTKYKQVQGVDTYEQVGKNLISTLDLPTEITEFGGEADINTWSIAELKEGKLGLKAYLQRPFDDSRNTTVNIYIYNIDFYISYILPDATTGSLSFKTNGTWKNVVSIFKKTNGIWVQQSNPTSLFTGSPSGTESNYLYLGE